MQIVIEIPEHIVKAYQDMIAMTNFEEISVQRGIIKSIANGTPLPKGHGRLIDADKLLVHKMYGIFGKAGYKTEAVYVDDINDAPTIIDKEE